MIGFSVVQVLAKSVLVSRDSFPSAAADDRFRVGAELIGVIKDGAQCRMVVNALLKKRSAARVAAIRP